MAKIIILAVVVALFLAPLVFGKTLQFDKFLQFLGKFKCKNGFRPFAPNWITVYSFILTAIGFYLYLAGKPVWGMTIGFSGAMLDHYDGKMARALVYVLKDNRKDWKGDVADYWWADITDTDGKPDNVKIGRATTRIGKWWLEFNFPGTTGLGKVFDPFADKVKALSMLAYFSFWADVLDPWLVAVIIAPEVFGTLLRRPFRLLGKFSTHDSASWVGKTKATLQWGSIVCCVVVELSHTVKTNWSFIPNLILGLTILFAVGSVLSRLNLKKLLNCSKAYLERAFRKDAVK